MNFDSIKKDIVSFADDDELFIEKNGKSILTRNQKTIEFQIEIDSSTGACHIKYGEKHYSYRDFIAYELANMELFAQKLIQKQVTIEPFIDSEAKFITNYKIFEDKSLTLLKNTCEYELPFSTKLSFITADAGHGKTILLQEFQKQIANDFLNKKSKYLFWHIDLKERDLVRLNEAISWELSELRLPGYFYNSILTLIKQGLLVFAIDGFDELAAEVGGSKALGALSSLVLSLEGKGTIIAASRRTFFNTQDYTKRAKLIQSNLSIDCEITELKLSNWSKKENIEYLGYFFDNPGDVLRDLVIELHDENHPLLVRPYLFTKIITISNETSRTPKEIIQGISNKKEGINIVVEAFVEREVDKWKDRDKTTGKPYLNFNQHIELLSAIANELWENQSDSISFENIQLILSSFLDDWKIEERLRPLISRMLESHALLVNDRIKDNYRKFEHVEFKYFFLAKELKKRISTAIANENAIPSVRKFLYLAQLQDSVALYLANELNGIDVLEIISVFRKVLAEQWKPTYLQINIGTLIPYVLDKKDIKVQMQLPEKITYSSLILEGKHLKNLCFANSNFVNISLKNTILDGIVFENCIFDDLRFFYDSNNNFSNVKAKDCTISSLSRINDMSEKSTEYTPSIIIQTLQRYGIEIVSDNQIEEKVTYKESEFKSAVKRFLTKFNTSTYQYEKDIVEDSLYGKDRKIILEDVIPFLADNNIIICKETKKSRRVGSTVWRLSEPNLSIILKGENDKSSEFYKFWEKVKKV
jgi:hypothetical protein